MPSITRWSRLRLITSPGLRAMPFMIVSLVTSSSISPLTSIEATWKSGPSLMGIVIQMPLPSRMSITGRPTLASR
jgi:hypothetical protein